MFPALLLALACGYPADRFAEDMAEATCTLYQDCGYLEVFGFESYDACLATVQGNYDPAAIECPDYDRKAALECVDGVQAMTCADLSGGVWPQACGDRCGASGDDDLDTGG